MLHVLEVREGNVADRFGTGFFADGMATHAIRDDEDVALGLPMAVITGRLTGASVLVVAALDADIG